MIKFLGEREGRPMIGLGLSRCNCEKLLEGKPIFIDLLVMMAELDSPPDLNQATVFLFAGEDEQTMIRQLGRVTELPSDMRPIYGSPHLGEDSTQGEKET